MQRKCCIGCVKLFLIIILWISLEKGFPWKKEKCFDVNHSLGFVYPALYIIRLLGQVYHFTLPIFYPCSFRICLAYSYLIAKKLVSEHFLKNSAEYLLGNTLFLIATYE